MSLGHPSVMARRLEPAVGNLLRVVAERNPFLSRETVVERTIVADRIGLLVGDTPQGTTLLYVWTQEDPGCLTWLIHLARWRSGHPSWRAAHGLAPCTVPTRVIVAVPNVVTGLRAALRLLVDSVQVVGYQCLDLDGKLVLGWESDAVPGHREDIERVTDAGTNGLPDPVQEHEPHGMTPDEWAYFQSLKN